MLLNIIKLSSGFLWSFKFSIDVFVPWIANILAAISLLCVHCCSLGDPTSMAPEQCQPSLFILRGVDYRLQRLAMCQRHFSYTVFNYFSLIMLICFVVCCKLFLYVFLVVVHMYVCSQFFLVVCILFLYVGYFCMLLVFVIVVLFVVMCFLSSGREEQPQLTTRG